MSPNLYWLLCGYLNLPKDIWYKILVQQLKSTQVL